jgi:hypothetical protein
MIEALRWTLVALVVLNFAGALTAIAAGAPGAFGCFAAVGLLAAGLALLLNLVEESLRQPRSNDWQHHG